VNDVLFDSPGPRTVARHRIYSVAALVALVAVIAFVAYQLNGAGQFAYAKWEPFLTPNYVSAILDGVLTTLQMALSAVLLALVLGVVLGVGKLSDHAWVRWPCWAVVEFFRAVPVLLLMILVFYSYGVTRGDTGAYWSVVIALTLYNGAVLAEVFRAGINAVPAGQAEAAYAIGMTKTQVMTMILLPQAVKIMLPAIISQCVVALKDTSLGYAVAAPGLTAVGRQIYTQFQSQVPTAIVLAAIYILLNLLLTAAATYAQRKLVGEKRPLDPDQLAALGDGAAGRAGGGVA